MEGCYDDFRPITFLKNMWPVLLAISFGSIFDSMIPGTVMVIIYGIIGVRLSFSLLATGISDFKEGIEGMGLFGFFLVSILTLLCLCAIAAGVYLLAKDVNIILK